MQPKCPGCGRFLSPAEQAAYGTRCEDCSVANSGYCRQNPQVCSAIYVVMRTKDRRRKRKLGANGG